VNNHLGCITN